MINLLNSLGSDADTLEHLLLHLCAIVANVLECGVADSFFVHQVFFVPNFESTIQKDQAYSVFLTERLLDDHVSRNDTIYQPTSPRLVGDYRSISGNDLLVPLLF